jgi:protein subunit release factor B
MALKLPVTAKKANALAERMARCGVKENQLKEKFIASSGPGGQKVNKSASCVYIKHIPTGIEVKMSKERSAGLNRYYARKRLCELIEEKSSPLESPSLKKEQKIRKQKNRRKRRAKNKKNNT